ncbi:hypothetical protein DL764_002075 [Monosporascus ibericus]|uniref:Vacuolar calcium ion transporter n=1 Tax=Monosporascus ibericus TaxID=155417 RepID=A0A4Q4TNA3_9PEZI|nr:hypothetical protein DL764_002075 [Monosporascus ibericus]
MARTASVDREKSRSRGPRHGPRVATLPQHTKDEPDGHLHSHAMVRIRGGLRIRARGDSGRSGLHPIQFCKIIWMSNSTLSRFVNILWPFVIAAIVIHYVREEQHVLKFSLAYVAMLPCANLIGFAGQELAKKIPHMLGVLLETTVGSVVEIILFLVLLLAQEPLYYVIQAAILGSILATMLLCLGVVFFTAGIRRKEATFDASISEVGSGLLLIAGLGLAIPSIFHRSLLGGELTTEALDEKTTSLSRIIAILLIVAYVVFIFFQMRTHHGIYDAVFEHDERRDEDAHKEVHREKLTLTECVVALAVSIALVTFIAIALVHEIPYIVEEQGISDPFMGLILVPLVEKAAEHLTAIDEAWDNQINFALSHCIGSTIQTAMLNAPLVVLVAWGRGLAMDFSFEIFDVAMLLVAIVTVGNFLRDQKSDYLEGFLCIIVYVAIAVAAAFYPNPPEVTAHH